MTLPVGIVRSSNSKNHQGAPPPPSPPPPLPREGPYIYSPIDIYIYIERWLIKYAPAYTPTGEAEASSLTLARFLSTARRQGGEPKAYAAKACCQHSSAASAGAGHFLPFLTILDPLLAVTSRY